MGDTRVPSAAVLASQTGQTLAQFREVRDDWASRPGMAAPLETARDLARLLAAEFPGQRPGLVLASAVQTLESARQKITERDGVELGAEVMAALALVAAVELEDGARS